MQNFYETNIKDILKALDTHESGLSSDEVHVRRLEYGFNRLPEAKAKSYFQIFLSQFISPLIYILLAASFIVVIMGDMGDAVIIFLVLIFNAIVGTVQEGKAQNTLGALKKFAETKATVLRNGNEFIIPDFEIVPGDIVILEEGDKIPADLRIIKSNSLRIDEAVLTGESEPVYKISEEIQAENLTIADQHNMAFKSTHVVAGNGLGVVVATGVSTEIGQISKKIASETDGSPLKSDIAQLSKIIIWSVAFISILIFAIGLIQGKGPQEMFITVVALSVSLVPEGLPIVVTLVLATGVWRMTKKNALVKKLQAVESLGQANVIAVDKTGTITKNEMVVKKIYFNEQYLNIAGDGYNPSSLIAAKAKLDKDYDFFLKLSSLSSNARIAFSEQQQNWIAIGDPTQAAMVCLSHKYGLKKEDLENSFPRIQEVPFDYRKKYHIVVNQIASKNVASVVSAPEVCLEISTKVVKNGKVTELSKTHKESLAKTYEEMSGQGLRVVGLSYKNINTELTSTDIEDFVFLGFIGIQDTIRPEAKDALHKAEMAGMKVVMITGDNKITAVAIAKEVGIYKAGDGILTGPEMDTMSDSTLAQTIKSISVFARVTPDHKLRIVNAYKHNGDIIAMTGDGVNDSPSLIAADLGVAMGKIGTEVAKESADIILLDDNFGNIVSAIEEGRSIYKTIKKVILYLFSTSLGEVLVIAGALILGYPLPILASQIIWLNFVTDGFLNVALALEPKEEGLLNGKFFLSNKYLLDAQMVKRMFVMAIPMMIGSLIFFRANYQIDIVKAWTITLTTMAIFQWFNAWNCRHESKSIFQMSFTNNQVLLASTGLVILLQVFAVYTPFMQRYLHTTNLSLQDWLLSTLMASTIIVAEEIRKYFFRRGARKTRRHNKKETQAN